MFLIYIQYRKILNYLPYSVVDVWTGSTPPNIPEIVCVETSAIPPALSRSPLHFRMFPAEVLASTNPCEFGSRHSVKNKV